MPTQAQLLNDLAKPFDDFPTANVTIGSKIYKALINEVGASSQWVDGGEVQVRAITVTLKRSDVVNMPHEGDTAYYNGEKLLVGTVTLGAEAENITVQLTYFTLS